MKLNLLKKFWLVLVLFSATQLLHAQFTVSGIVSEGSGETLIGVSIIEKGTTRGTITDLDGNFSMDITEGPTTLVFSYTGFATTEIEVDNNTSLLEITLREDIASLEEIVVTGLATTVKRSNLANSVARIDAAELTGVAQQSTIDGALYGKFKGAEIRASSGAPGGGISFKLRGTTSINGSSQPLIILDGVYIDNSSIPSGLNVVSAASGGGSTSNQDNPSNRLADIDPNDIESVEILKGASAAAIYGSRAAGGVVILTTKRGTSGKTKVTLAQSIGQTRMLNPLGVRQWTDERVLASNFADDIELFRTAAAGGTLINYEDELFGNKGTLYNTRLSASGGDGKTSFYIGGSYKNEEGIVSNTGYNKVAARINLDHQLSSKIKVAVSTNYINSSADRGFFNNDNSGTTMGISFSQTPSWAQLLPDRNGIFPANPYAASNFLETGADITNNESVNRFIGGGTITANLLEGANSNLKFIFRGGVDFYNLNSTALFPNTLQFQRDGNGLNGVSVQGFTKSLNTNLAAFLVYSHFTDNNLTLRTQVGVTQEDFDRNTILGEATNLIGTQTNLDQAGSRNVTQSRSIQQDKGFFIQEEVNFQDKIVATIGVRADKSSNNGDVNELYFYPKANVAFNLHNFGLFGEESPITQAKVRAAYGESGNFARFGSKSTILNSSIVNGTAGVAVPGLLGNNVVGPERQKEFEVGLDVELNNRFAVDLTYYIKSVEDLLLNADVPTSSGFSSQVTNAAELQNKGVEIGLNLSLVNTKDFDWFVRTNFWTNSAEVTKLDVPSFTTGGFADFLGNFRIQEGRSPTEIIGVGENPDEDGLTVYGDAEPDFQIGLTNQITWKNFDFTMVWHWKEGGKNINLSALLFDLNNTTWDFDDTDLDPNGELTNGNYRLSILGSNTEPLIEDSWYIRLREVGLYYRIPKFNDAVDIKVGFSGNNLVNFFDYRSYDPEVSNFGSGGLSTGVEVNPFPSSKRFDFHVIANF